MRNLPNKLPQTPAECELLWQWRELVKGWSQNHVAKMADVFQGRISEIERGRVIPQRKHWPALMAAYGLVPEQAGEFYRMCVNAKRLCAQTRSLTQDYAEQYPLFARAQAQLHSAELTREAVQALASAVNEQKARLA